MTPPLKLNPIKWKIGLNFGEHLRHIRLNKDYLTSDDLTKSSTSRYIYKSFIISHFACRHISDQVNNNSFHNNLKSIERNVLSKITGAKWSTSKEYI